MKPKEIPFGRPFRASRCKLILPFRPRSLAWAGIARPFGADARQIGPESAVANLNL